MLLVVAMTAGVVGIRIMEHSQVSLRPAQSHAVPDIAVQLIHICDMLLLFNNRYCYHIQKICHTTAAYLLLAPTTHQCSTLTFVVLVQPVHCPGVSYFVIMVEVVKQGMWSVQQYLQVSRLQFTC